MTDLTTKPDIFIIESLKYDEEKDHKEGEMIFRSLTMSAKKPEYRYIRTKTKLEHFTQEFKKGRFRYLHLSCHGSRSGISTTLDDLTIDEFAEIVGPSLGNRRLFLSTCQASTLEMASAIFKHSSSCMSVAGPKNKIYFDDSVIMWTSFYHLMFKQNNEAMSRARLQKTLTLCSKLVGEAVNLFVPGNGSKPDQLPIPAPVPSRRGSSGSGKQP